jgi:K(+)-stimulated pyrophosphate-energized sodium pump
MKFLQRATRAAKTAVSKRALALLTTAGAVTLLPSFAFGSEGDNVVLKFDQAQTIGLWLSIAVAVLALFYGLVFLRSSVMAQSPGNEKMQEVGAAIRSGALAYLQKQITTMALFIVLLFAGLVALYWRFGPATGLGVGACFVAGVISSYISGYAGMLMAVNGNTRTANAALTSGRLSFMTAFRSGAVAGMVTVGIGLLGASVIVLFFPAYATKLLVGFGFGASLAALFMRVGGGIFTKAADVGADLVGKVEAGIPEDDPRNPATIADNVGDNVGDCAGMAADVFESYEVTLVAAIILSAATAAVFDAATWPRLVVFGLAASALGLLGSMIGVQMVNGSDDPNADPLKALNRGFNISRFISWLLIGVLAYFLMGGKGAPIQTSQLVSTTQVQLDRIQALQAIRNDLATKQHKEPWQIQVGDVLADPRAKALGMQGKQDEQEASSDLQMTPDQYPKVPDFSGMRPVTDFTDTSNKALGYSTQPPMLHITQQPSQTLVTLGSALKGLNLVVAQLHNVEDMPARPAVGNNPATPAQHIDRTQWVGPVPSGLLDEFITAQKTQIKNSKSPASIDVVQRLPVSVFASSDGQVVYGVEGNVSNPSQLRVAGAPGMLIEADPSVVNSLMAASSSPNPPPMPPRDTIQIGLIKHAVVPWYLFWLTITFGILMAFAIEWITDYFVSTHKAPTKEVAGVATAGAAPMVIQGFAHALTSSVYMVLAIVVALLFPLFIFNPATYGSYILSFYGIALVGLGLLTATSYVLAMDTFGPISDNAQGVFEMSGAAETNPEAAKIVARLDAAGNTTKALTKGFAIATAVVAAVALFHSYLEGAQLGSIGLRLDVPEIFLGLLIGGAAPYLFSAFAINAVGRSSFELINEVRRQFREDPGIMKGTSKPNYARCVAIVTAAAQKELLSPGILAIALPAAVGFGFGIGKPSVSVNGQLYNLTGAQALGGFLAGAIVSGQLLAVTLANAGGMWDNAKKLIEDGLHGGKGTDAHKAAVVGDTIGDPFKDTAGPALNPLIKVMNLVGLLISGVVIIPMADSIRIGVTLVCILALGVSVALARRGSMSEALSNASGSSEPPAISTTAVTATVTPDEPVAAASGRSKKKLFVEEDSADSNE